MACNLTIPVLFFSVSNWRGKKRRRKRDDDINNCRIRQNVDKAAKIVSQKDF